MPLLLQLPRPIALGLGATAVFVALVSRTRLMPGWVRVVAALVLATVVMAVMGFNLGRDTGCALLAAMLAIKPAETVGLRDARSLVGFALFAPFATFLLDQGPVSLGLGLLAATLALVAMQRLADLESGDVERAVAPWRRVTSAWRMVAIGLPLALAAFWLFPRLASPLWGAPERAQPRPGLSDSMTPGEWVDMLTDDTPAARATSDRRAVALRFMPRARLPIAPPRCPRQRSHSLDHHGLVIRTDGRSSSTQHSMVKALPVTVAAPHIDRCTYAIYAR